MSESTPAQALAGLVHDRWRGAEIGEELGCLADVSRVRFELLANGRSVTRQLIWERPQNGHLPAPGRTVRLGLFDLGDVVALAERSLEPIALYWAGRIAVVGPMPSAASVLAALSHEHHPGHQPAAGLLSLPVDAEPSWPAVEIGWTRWTRAVNQAVALRWPAAPHRSVVQLQAFIAGHESPLSVEILQPRSTPAHAGGTSIAVSWSSARALWANFAAQLTLDDAVLTGLCTIEGDLEAFLWLFSGFHPPY